MSQAGAIGCELLDDLNNAILERRVFGLEEVDLEAGLPEAGPGDGRLLAGRFRLMLGRPESAPSPGSSEPESEEEGGEEEDKERRPEIFDDGRAPASSRSLRFDLLPKIDEDIILKRRAMGRRDREDLVEILVRIEKV
jgi:hypothetical protein